jgi:Na+-driven multidrug efflux pump
MWVAVLTGVALQALTWWKAPDIIACELARPYCLPPLSVPCLPHGELGQQQWRPALAACRCGLPLPRADMSGSDAVVASLALIYLRARSWGLPAALIMMVAIGAGRCADVWSGSIP